jgi:hypothetical protein
MPNAPAMASVSVDRIAQVFNYEWAMSEPVPGVDTYWWWVRDVRLDPDEVIASDGEGGTWRVPFTTDGDFDVTFGDPVQVRETYVDVAAPAAAASAATARVNQRVAARGLPKPDKPDPNPNPAASAATTQEDDPVTIDIPALRSRLQLSEEQLPDDATEEQINAVLTTAPETPEEPEAVETPEEPETPAEQPELAAAATADGTVVLDRATYDQLRRGAEDGVAARAEQLRQDREATVASAVKDGRIPPARRDHWVAQLAADPEGASATLAELAPGTIPVAARGTDTSPQQGAITSTGWFPQLTQEA